MIFAVAFILPAAPKVRIAPSEILWMSCSKKFSRRGRIGSKFSDRAASATEYA
jgi:hypothetical protein